MLIHRAARPAHLMDAEVGVGVEVVILGCHVLGIGLLAALGLATGHLARRGWGLGSDPGWGRSHSHKNLRLPMVPCQVPQTPPDQDSPGVPVFHSTVPPNPVFHVQDPPDPSPAYHLSSLSAPGSSSAHSWGREGEAEGQTPGRVHGVELELRKQPQHWGGQGWGPAGPVLSALGLRGSCCAVTGTRAGPLGGAGVWCGACHGGAVGGSQSRGFELD